MAFLGALLLVSVLLVRPQEFIPALQPLSLLNAATALAIAGILFEVASRRRRLFWTPQIPWLLAFVGWCFLVTVRRLGKGGLTDAWEFVGLSAIFMVVVTFSIASVERWRGLGIALIAIGTFIGCTCIHQGQQPAQCIVVDTSSPEGEQSGEGEPDGRSCDTSYVCEQQGKPHATYLCEKVGLFGTFTAGQRVRWRGTLGDPNELAVLLGATMPLIFAFMSATKKPARGWVTIAGVIGLAIALGCIVLTRSRGGQLVILAVFGFYFVRRYGLKGLIFGAILASPVLVFGGRGGEEAESSSLERIDLLYDGIDMIRSYPVLGVGTGQFVEHTFNGLTAHNSYVLAAAELGLPGSLLWLMLCYTSIKIPWTVATRPPRELDPAFVPFALALVVAFAGIFVGIFFLSFCYKAVLFVFFGLAGAMYGAVKRVSPTFDVRITPREIASIAIADVAVLAFVLVYSHVIEAHA